MQEAFDRVCELAMSFNEDKRVTDDFAKLRGCFSRFVDGGVHADSCVVVVPWAKPKAWVVPRAVARAYAVRLSAYSCAQYSTLYDTVVCTVVLV